MKKLSALLLALLLAATMCVGAMAETVSYVGTWVLTSIVSGETAMDPATLGMDMAIILYEDGTCTLSMLGVSEQGTWEPAEGGVSLTDAAGTTDVLAYRDGALVMSAEGIEMILTPGTIEATTADEGEYAEVLANLTIADFAGNWVMDHVECTYGWYEVEELGAEMTVVIVDATAVITMSYTDETVGAATEVYNAILETEEAEDLGTILWAAFVNEAGEPDGSGMMFLLFDDGQLVWYEYDSENEAEFYYCFINTAETTEAAE
ncbi:MAG: hypothetical protein IJE07_10750 [Clostridia bacterium]|nr:hypothetical protein [Clostridia bacterium]